MLFAGVTLTPCYSKELNEKSTPTLRKIEVSAANKSSGDNIQIYKSSSFIDFTKDFQASNICYSSNETDKYQELNLSKCYIGYYAKTQ